MLIFIRGYHGVDAGRAAEEAGDNLYIHTAGPDQYEFIESYGRDVLLIIREKNRQRYATAMA